MMRGLLLTFVDAVTAARVPYFMYGGTLLGSYRHHSVIPWDDDLDLIVDATKKDELKLALEKYSPEMMLSCPAHRWKFYYNDATPIDEVEWRYPFIDISFYETNGYELLDSDLDYPLRYNISDVFPLCNRPFWNMTLRAPRDTHAFLTAYYDLDICSSTVYNHKLERKVDVDMRVAVYCSRLWHRFPFVFHNATPTGSVETLKIGSTVISSVFIPSDC